MVFFAVGVKAGERGRRFDSGGAPAYSAASRGQVSMSGSAFGEHLKRERELRGVSLEEVSRATCIGARFLEAIEAGRWEVLPGGVFNRGFIRAIGQFLGLDEENLIAEYAMETHDALRVSVVDRRPRPSLGLPLLALALALGLLAGGIIGVRRAGPHMKQWFRSRWEGRKTGTWNAPQNPPAPLPIAKGEDGSAGKNAAEEASSAAAPAEMSPAATAAGGTAAGTTPAATEKTATVAATAQPTQGPGSQATAPGGEQKEAATAENSAGGFVLVLRMRGPGHVTVTQDGYRMLDKTLAAGETRTYYGKQQYDVTVDDAQAIVVTLDGKTIPFPARAGGDAASRLTLRRNGATASDGGRNPH